MRKELQTYPMMAGSVVDYIIAKTLKAFKEDGEVKSDLGNVGRRWFRRSIAEGERIAEQVRVRPRSYQERKASPFSPSHDHFHGIDRGSDHLQGLEDRVASCLETFEHSEVLEKLQSVGPDNWGPITTLEDGVPTFGLEDIMVYAAFDIWLIDDGHVVILDWKSGRPSPSALEGAEQQLSVYALWAQSTMKSESGVMTQAIWLQDSAAFAPVPITESSIDDVKGRIRKETAMEASLLTLIEDEEGRWRHAARREDFPAKPQTMRCCDCKYQTICPEGTEATAHMRPPLAVLAAA